MIILEIKVIYFRHVFYICRIFQGIYLKNDKTNSILRRMCLINVGALVKHP